MPCKVRRTRFGTMPDGRPVEQIALTNANGVEVRILSLGAAIQAAIVPDRSGRLADVAPGFDTLDAWLAQTQHFGVTVGRVANRIAGGRFTLDGRAFTVPANNGANALHGGPCGFDRANWQVAMTGEGQAARVALQHISPDGDQGFPGTLEITATYSLDDANCLSLDYRATTDAATLVNLSNHAYWALGGEGAAEGAMGHTLTIPADHYLPTDAAAIPTGEFRQVAGTAFDFRQPTPIGARIRDASEEQLRFGRGYDHNWVIAREASEKPRLLARLADPVSGRVLEILSNQPGLQFYSGNFLDGSVAGKSGRFYRMGDAVALEPQMFPDTPNRPEFGSVRLAPGETYRNRIIWQFSAIPAAGTRNPATGGEKA
jgi:aldose 1-epimerase